MSHVTAVTLKLNMIKAIVDRIEDNKAVLELEDRRTITIDISRIDNAKEGDILYLKLDINEEIIDFFIDPKETKERKKTADERLKRLFKK